MDWETKKLLWLTLLRYSLYCHGLELNQQYLQGLPIPGSQRRRFKQKPVTSTPEAEMQVPLSFSSTASFQPLHGALCLRVRAKTHAAWTCKLGSTLTACLALDESLDLQILNFPSGKLYILMYLLQGVVRSKWNNSFKVHNTMPDPFLSPRLMLFVIMSSSIYILL